MASEDGVYDSSTNQAFINATANASGIAQGSIGPCPSGYQWYVERYSTFVNTSATPALEIFVMNSPTLPSNYTATLGDRQGRMDYTSSGKNAQSDNNSPVIVQEGQWLIAGWTGATSGDQCQLSIQYHTNLKTLRIEPMQLIQQTAEHAYIGAPEHAVEHNHHHRNGRHALLPFVIDDNAN